MRTNQLIAAILGIELTACGGELPSTTGQRAEIEAPGWLALPTTDYLPNDFFGWSVAFDGSRVLVGSPGRDGVGDAEADSGGARLFNRTPNGLAADAELVADNRLLGAGLGDAVALHGETAAIANFAAVAPPLGDDDLAHATDAGLAYAFRRRGTKWLAQRLPDPEFGSGRQFGLALAATDDEVFVSAPAVEQTGAVYRFRFHDDESWHLEQSLTPPPERRVVGDAFGWSLALDDETLLVGAPGVDLVHVFHKDAAGSWNWATNFGAAARGTEPVPADCFGYAVALHGARALVSATACETRAAAYAFFREDTGWEKTHDFFPDGEDLALGGFAEKLALAEDRLWIGAPRQGPGTVASFEWSVNNWLPETPLIPELAANATCASGLSASGRSVLVGCPHDQEARGSAFLIAQPNGAACNDDIDCQSDYCVEGLCCDSPCSGCYSCRAADKAEGDDGECGPVAAGVLPRSGSCASGPADVCGPTGACDGRGACELQQRGTTCAPAHCLGPAELSTRACDGNGVCLPASTKACGHLSCVADSCQPCKRDQDCRESELCGADGCEQKRELSSPCTTPGQCKSEHCLAGHCADGAECSGDGAQVLQLDGSTLDCGAYVCRDGACLEACQDSADCRGGLGCSEQGRCDPLASEPSSRATGCDSAADCEQGFACSNEKRCEPIPDARFSRAAGGCSAAGHGNVRHGWGATLLYLLACFRARRARSTNGKNAS